MDSLKLFLYATSFIPCVCNFSRKQGGLNTTRLPPSWILADLFTWLSDSIRDSFMNKSLFNSLRCLSFLIVYNMFSFMKKIFILRKLIYLNYVYQFNKNLRHVKILFLLEWDPGKLGLGLVLANHQAAVNAASHRLCHGQVP